jgi:hypothetical protein
MSKSDKDSKEVFNYDIKNTGERKLIEEAFDKILNERLKEHPTPVGKLSQIITEEGYIVEGKKTVTKRTVNNKVVSEFKMEKQ